MWAFFVNSAGVGPKGIPVTEVTADILAEKFEALSSDEIQQKARDLSYAMSRENGIECGLEHFLEHLPREWEGLEDSG